MSTLLVPKELPLLKRREEKNLTKEEPQRKLKRRKRLIESKTKIS
jgi:hypothetical protein